MSRHSSGFSYQSFLAVSAIYLAMPAVLNAAYKLKDQDQKMSRLAESAASGAVNDIKFKKVEQA